MVYCACKSLTTGWAMMGWVGSQAGRQEIRAELWWESSFGESLFNTEKEIGNEYEDGFW